MDRCIYIGVVYDLFKLFLYEGAAMAVLLEIVSVHVLELCVNFSFAIQIWQSIFFYAESTTSVYHIFFSLSTPSTCEVS